MRATWHSVCWVSVVPTLSCLEEERTGERGGGRGKRARAAGAGMTRFCFRPDEGRAPWSSVGAKEGPLHHRVTPTLVPALPPADMESNERAEAP